MGASGQHRKPSLLHDLLRDRLTGAAELCCPEHASIQVASQLSEDLVVLLQQGRGELAVRRVPDHRPSDHRVTDYGAGGIEDTPDGSPRIAMVTTQGAAGKLAID